MSPGHMRPCERWGTLALQVRADQREAGGYAAPFALCGFAAIAARRYGALLVRGSVGLLEDVRYGALAIAGAFAWIELQAFHPGAGPHGIAWWVHGTFIAAIATSRAARAQAQGSRT